MGCGRVAEAVRADGRSALDATDELGHDGAHLARIDAPPATPEEEGRLGGVAGEQRAAVPQVLVEPLSCGNAKGDDALPVALAAHADDASAVVERVEVEADEFADPDARRVEQLDGREVA